MTDKNKMRKRLIGLGPEMLADILLNIASTSNLIMDTILLAELAKRAEQKIQIPKEPFSSNKTHHRTDPVAPSGTDQESMLLKVSLPETDPTVWRTLLVSASADLAHLHAVIQIAMGWKNRHTFVFYIDGQRYEDTPYRDEEFASESKPISGTKLRTLIRRRDTPVRYMYNMGDEWVHWIERVSYKPSENCFSPVCLEGANACPPEDCDGPSRFEDFKRIIADPSDDEYEEMKEWYGGPFNPSAFDIEETNRHLSLLSKIRGHISQEKLGEILIKRYGLDR